MHYWRENREILRTWTILIRFLTYLQTREFCIIRMGLEARLSSYGTFPTVLQQNQFQ